MANGTYDIITLGGGLGGSTLAKAIAGLMSQPTLDTLTQRLDRLER